MGYPYVVKLHGPRIALSTDYGMFLFNSQKLKEQGVGSSLVVPLEGHVYVQS